MEFNKVLNGIVKYIDKEIMHNLNSWQEVLARISMSRAINNSQGIKDFITKNGYIRTFAICDDQGNIDVDGLINDIKTVARNKGCIEIDIPLFGNFKFNENDINTLHQYIKGT